MKLAFCLFEYFPYGGLQRDFLRIAKTCLARGHTIDVYTMDWLGDKISGLNLHLLPSQGWQNHSRRQNFVKQVAATIRPQQYDLIVGFNKMPGLDVYYAADVCYQARVKTKHGSWYRLLPRHRHLVAFEKAVFALDSHTEVLLISPKQQAEFQAYYQTPVERFHHLPPGIDRNRIAPANSEEIRHKVRTAYRFDNNDNLLLMVGSGFKTKGVDRALLGLAALPEFLKQKTQLMIIGQDHPEIFQRQAKQLHIADRVHFLGGRDDVPDFLLAADLLIHPAYHENTGTALLEAVVAGLPVLTVDVCGYAHYIEEAHAGKVLASPFQQAQFNKTLEEMLLSKERSAWHANALSFAHTADLYSMPERAADIIEKIGRKRVHRS